MDTTQSLQTVAQYVTALGKRQSEQMEALRSPDFVLDFVHGDAFEEGPLSAGRTAAFWPAWFAAFPEMDYEVTRTIAAEQVIVTQWIFTGTQTEPLGPPVFAEPHPPTHRTIRFRGVSVYDIDGNGGIQRETTYMDLATLMIELGVER